jgi:hypothetical protein
MPAQSLARLESGAMTELELTYDSSSAVSYSDPEGVVPTSATVTLTKPDGSSVESPVVTKPTLSTTVAAGSTASSLVLAAVTGIVPGNLLRITTAGIVYVVEAKTINGTTKTVALLNPMPVAPTTGDAVKALKMTATLAAVGSTGIGSNYRLTWRYDDGTTYRQAGIPVAVVRWPWTNPCSAQDVREIAAELGAGSWSETRCDDVAARVADKIRGRIQQTGRRPALYLSSEVFADVARAGIRYELAQRGVCLGGQVYEAQRELRFAFDDQLTQVITGLAAYDSDADGKISAAEAKPMAFTI